jgi:signal transduction histidine kinase
VHRLTQVMANLLTNSAKYTPEGQDIWIDVRREVSTVQIRVRDAGLGIASDVLPRVFDLFVQSADALSRRAGGLGIGLALVKRLVELHGGTVTAHSDGPGKGSEFVVTLPAL